MMPLDVEYEIQEDGMEAEERDSASGSSRRATVSPSGDLGGAVAGLDPAATTERARSAEALAPAYYHVVLRYPLSVIPQAEPEGE